MNCTADSNCSPSNITGYLVPNGVKCINNVCVCSGSCFSLSTMTSRCTYSTCGWYNPNTTVCTAFAPKSQLTAFLLSFFVMPTGAANFYIGQNGLGNCLCMSYAQTPEVIQNGESTVLWIGRASCFRDIRTRSKIRFTANSTNASPSNECLLTHLKRKACMGLNH